MPMTYTSEIDEREFDDKQIALLRAFCKLAFKDS